MTVKVLGRRLPATATYVAALSAALLLLMVAIGLAVMQAEQHRADNVAVRYSVEFRNHIRDVLDTLQDAEIGQRGYLITGDTNYLAPFAESRTRIQSRLTALEDFTRRHPDQYVDAVRLRELTERKMDEMQLTIDLRAAGRTGEALAIVRSDAGKQLMDEARALIAQMWRGAQADLDLRINRADRDSIRLRWIMIAAAALLIGIIGLLVYTVRGAMRELRASRDEALAAQERVMSEMARREHAETRVVQMQKMEAIGQLTGGVAHDFNNMLAVITSALNLMRKRLERGETDITRFLDAGLDAAHRAATLTSRLLAFARRTPLAPSVLELNRVVGGMSELLRRVLGENVQVETVLAGGLWRVNVDASQLENAIVNICVNARDAMGEAGGKLTIETSNAFLDDAYADKYDEVQAGQYVMVAITDTGSGMTPEVMQRAFEPFFTTKAVGQGTGLGLSQVHGFLKQSGGHIAIYSELGHGTTVKLYLPRTHEALTEEAPARERTAPPPGEPGVWVLVVEDDDRVRVLSVAALRELGYSVLHASNGQDALRKLEAHPNIALLFTDIVMPDMSGRKLSDEALRRWPHLKVLYTTGYTQNAIVHNGVVDADARLLMKPYSLDDLAFKVRAALDSK